ncbi:hypothetical protein H6F67_15615 [Microcoleus sp. FACHB-1515]|uniref:hypothetical protein n=1 Tax=Microcoleus sp. FACHB-1515 TaxID=2692821 RepID=UPI001684BB50|nr:hypothetical protein [Microcoleus sp. FACHB-1515]MBD2091283.1 hypothetical protein [Microcoleus sp. FACHB-1515]
MRYWQFVGIDAAGNRRVEVIAPARTFFKQQFSTGEEIADASVQRQLIAIVRSKAAIDRQAAESCLRCFISNQSAWICRELVAQFGQKGGFTWADLYSLVLDDRLPLDRRQTSNYQSVATRILQTVDLNLGQLSTWTKRLVMAELNPFLLNCGIYIASDWSLLNIPIDRLRRLCKNTFRLPDSEIQKKVHLLTAYHQIYRRDRLRELGSQSRRKYAEPTVEQIDEMMSYLRSQNLQYSAKQLLEELQDLAQLIRQNRCPETISIDDSNNHALIEQSAPEDNSENELLNRYRQDLLECLEASLTEVVTQYHQKKKPDKAAKFLPALCLFHCESRSMGRIAKEMQLGTQSTVSRLLELDQLRASVRQTLLLKLRDRVKALAETYSSRSRLEAIDQQLDTILLEQIDPIIAAAAAEANTPNQPRNSLFSRRLCRYLKTQNIALCTH